MSFQEILEFLNFLYSVGMLFEFAAFIKLRIKKPDLHRPYKVPVKTFGATMLCLPPVLLLVLVMCLASLKTYLVSGGVIVLGFFLYPAIVHAKERNWTKFSTEIQPSMPSDSDLEGRPIVLEEHQEIDEAARGLLSDSQSSRTEQVSDISSEGVSKLE